MDRKPGIRTGCKIECSELSVLHLETLTSVEMHSMLEDVELQAGKSSAEDNEGVRDNTEETPLQTKRVQIPRPSQHVIAYV